MSQVVSELRAHPVSFRAGPLAGRLDERATEWESRGAVAKRDLGRYYALLAAELETVYLAEGEAALVVEACTQTVFDERSYRLLWDQVADAIQYDGLAAKWQVDGPALVARLRALTPGQALAVVDAVERFRRAPEPRAARLRDVGLVHDTRPGLGPPR